MGYIVVLTRGAGCGRMRAGRPRSQGLKRFEAIGFPVHTQAHSREVEMRIRRQRRSSFWRVWGTAVISVGALVVIAAAAAIMLFAASPAAAEEVPRRHDGRPDLSGTYDIATLTPAQRPERYGERLALTPEEAAAIAEHWATNFNKDHAPSDPNREAPPKGGTGIYAPEFTGAAGKVGGYNALPVHGRGSGLRDRLEGRVPVAGDRQQALRVRLPRGELRARRHPPGARLLEQEAIEQGQGGTSTGSGSGD